MSFSISQGRRLIVKVNEFADLIIAADPLESGQPTLGAADVKNVMDFSPDAAGAAISTSQVQAAIDRVSANHTSKSVLYFPAGIYKLGTINLNRPRFSAAPMRASTPGGATCRGQRSSRPRTLQGARC